MVQLRSYRNYRQSALYMMSILFLFFPNEDALSHNITSVVDTMSCVTFLWKPANDIDRVDPDHPFFGPWPNPNLMGGHQLQLRGGAFHPSRISNSG